MLKKLKDLKRFFSPFSSKKNSSQPSLNSISLFPSSSYRNNRPKLFIRGSVKQETLDIISTIYNDLEIYSIDNNVAKVNEIISHYSENKLNPTSYHPKNENSIIVNSYGDITFVSNDDLMKKNEFLQRLNILSSPCKILKLNTYDYMMLYTTNESKKNITYSHTPFVLFRYIYRNMLKMFNMFFYVYIPDFPVKEIEPLNINKKIYLLQRENFWLRNKNSKPITIQGEKFFYNDLTNAFTYDNIKLYMKILLKDFFFFYYANMKINHKSAIERLNLVLEKEPYFSVQGNLLNKSHLEQMKEFTASLAKNIDKVPENSSIIFWDNIYSNASKLEVVQTFSEKNFEVKLDKGVIKENIPYHESRVLKKKFIDISNVKWYKDIIFSENSYFSEKI